VASDQSARPNKALVAELILVGLLLGYDPFSVHQLVLLLLLASQSLWIRRLSWSDLGLRRPTAVWRTLGQAAVAATAILIAVRTLIVPFAVRITGVPLDLSALIEPGDVRALAVRLGQAWSLAAFGEEMVFRGYLMHRVVNLVGETRLGWTVALVSSSALFGLAHRYQGWAGVIATASIGALMGLLYLYGRRNLWIVITCHALVDTVALLAIYFNRSSWLFPSVDLVCIP
jgi:membrane protease YdiL (CAAX protease family)